jgi:two-component system, chemotaxis family, response regulator Rcp1
MPAEAVGRPMEVLLVEDSLVFARLAVGAVKKSQVPHRLTWLADGQEAADFLNRQGRFANVPAPDLVLLDLELPGMPGRELLALIRGSADLKETPVVVMTGHATSEDEQVISSLSVQGYLTKPIDLTQFLALLRSLSHLWKNELVFPGSLRG